jgi:ribonucleoside-diphosphate reductase alpha chain
MTEPIAPEWLSEEGMHTLSAGYLLPGETPRAMFQRVAKAAATINNDAELEQDLFTCLWNGWIGLASPVAANFGTSRALPISCYSVHLSDSVSSIYSHLKEVAQLSKNGGGVGVYFGDVRPAGAPISGGGKSTGIVPWAQQYDLAARVVSQGGVRRGSFAIYLPIDHPDVPELLRAKDHSKGDPRKFIDSNVALTISDEWVESMIAGDAQKQELFGEVLKTRMISGSPYLVFIDNANAQNPECYNERGLSVKTSNLCSEIFLHTDEHHSFVCVLSSLNLSRYDDFSGWKSPITGRTVPQLAVHLLDAVVSEFIRKAKDKVGLGRAVRFAEKSRALGLGTMGLHTLYQKRGLPFSSPGARELNIETHRWVREQAEIASRELAERFEEPEWCVGSGRRHTHLIAVAPTRTNSVISGAFSQGIEPIDSNYFVAKQAKGTYVRKNPVLEKLLCDRGVGPEIWEQILEAKGSVQDLPCLTDREKEIFKTAREIDQFELVKQASDRQQFICQGQSLNLFVDPECDAAYIMRLHLSAWKMGLKSLYYLKSSSLLTKKKVVPALVVTKEDCPWCDKLKEALSQNEIVYQEISKEEAQEKGYWNPEWKTVPQLWLYKKHIGGYTDFVQYAQTSQIPQQTDTETKNYAECTACEA